MFVKVSINRPPFIELKKSINDELHHFDSDYKTILVNLQSMCSGLANLTYVRWCS